MSRSLTNPQNGHLPTHFSNNAPNGYPGNARQLEIAKLDIVDLLKRKFWFILFFVLIGLALSVLYFFRMPKTFESTAKIFVDEKNAPSISDKDDNKFGDESPVEKYMQVIKSSRILKPAIEAGDFQSLQTFKSVDDVLFELKEEDILDVVPADSKGASGVIKLAVRGATKEECQLMLRNIVQSFDDYIKSTTKNLGGETAELVQRMQDQLTGRLTIVNQEIQELISRPEMLTIGGHVVNPYHLQQQQMSEDLHDLLRERTHLEARAENIRASKLTGKELRMVMADVLKEFNKESEGSLGSYVATHNQYVQLKVTEQEMVNQFGDQHPDLIAIRNQIEMLDSLRQRELTSLQRGQTGEDNGTANPPTEIFLDLMDTKIAMLKSEEQSLQRAFQEIQRKSQALAGDVEKLTSLQREREQLESGYSAIVERLGEIKAYETHLWRNMTVLDPPTIGDQVAPNLPISLAGGLLLGSLVGFLFAGFKELAEKTFHSSEDISSLLGSRVVGHIHQFEKTRARKNPEFPNIAPEIVALHQPASHTSEAYRAIRTTLFFKAQEKGAKVIQITSPTPGDGKSTTISNLAASIAQSGRKVLLIDADLRKPTQHKLFGVSNAVGLSTVIEGDVSPMKAVQSIDNDSLSLVTCGPIPANPAELLTTPRFAEILNEYREHFDFILIDSPPLLAVTDPSIICTNADLVYMVMRIRNGIRTNSQQAKEIVESMGVEIGGLVVNGLRRRDQKNYQYSTGYGYGRYSYGNGNTVARTNDNSKRAPVMPRETETIQR